MVDLIIGLTGPNASGKGEICKYLEKKNFQVLSLSDVIREEIRKNKKEITRENLIKFGNKLRKKYGKDILAKRILKMIKKSKVVIDSIRNPEEVNILRKVKNFYLIAVDAPEKMRFDRIKKRNRENDPKSFKKFIEFEKKENSNNAYSQRIRDTMKLCDYFIVNDRDLTTLFKKIDRILYLIKNGRKKEKTELG